MKIKGLILTCLVMAISGCSGLLTSNQHVNQFYTINAVDYQPKTAQLDPSISIESPNLSKGLDSNKIMLMHSPQQLDYYANARWNETLGRMVQATLIESFENSNVLGRVSSDLDNIKPSYVLLLEVQNFQAEYSEAGEPPIIHIKLVAKLAKYPTRELAATFTAEVFQQADTKALNEIMYTFDQAYGHAQKMLIDELVDYFAG